MPYFALTDIESKEVFPGYRGRFYHSEGMTVAHWEIKANCPLPEHAHHHEQIVNVVDGRFELTIDQEIHVLNPGDVAVIPPNVTHGGKGHTDCRIIDVFHPVREDYRY